MLMHELLHFAAGARTPIVMFNVNRTPASPWGFWPDQIDSLSQRDTGWVQLYSETPQESLDSVIQAFRIAEATDLPVMVNHDAFYVSHALEPVSVPPVAMVQDFLPRPDRPMKLDPGLGQSLGAPIGQSAWNATRRDMDAAMARVPGLTDESGAIWGKLTGRPRSVFETYRTEDAEVVFVTMGSMAGTVREAIDRLRDDGIAAGLLKLRLFRPFPAAHLRDALKGVPCAVVLDRNYSPGLGGVLHQELKAALYGMPDAPRLHGMLTGVGGVNVPVSTIEQLARDYRAATPSPDPVWVE
jgi:pyruvate/2-oxoacid:ferredoxin oxidoreductase alpha subunit